MREDSGIRTPKNSLVMYLQLFAQVEAGLCLSINCTLKAQHQAKDMLRHFNV